MKKIIQAAILLVFIFYWFITLLYCSPENYIKIKSAGVLSKFEMFYYQKWSFFAPPPDFNFRLYFEYFDKDSTQLSVYEVLKPLAKEKQINAPFNSSEQYIDYIINSSIIELNDLLVDYHKLATATHPELSSEKNYSQAVMNFNANADKAGYPGYLTLINYFDLHKQAIIKKEGRLENAVYGRMSLLQSSLPRFENRDSLLNKGYTPKETPIFQSTLIKLK